MLLLDEHSLCFAFNECRDRPRFSVSVLTMCRSTWEKCYDLLKARFGREIWKVRKYQFMFENGSMIFFVPANDQARAYRADLVLVSETVPTDIRYDIASNIETRNVFREEGEQELRMFGINHKDEKYEAYKGFEQNCPNDFLDLLNHIIKGHIPLPPGDGYFNQFAQIPLYGPLFIDEETREIDPREFETKFLT